VEREPAFFRDLFLDALRSDGRVAEALLELITKHPEAKLNLAQAAAEAIAVPLAALIFVFVALRGSGDYISLHGGFGFMTSLLLWGFTGNLRLAEPGMDFVFSTPVSPPVVYVAKTATSAAFFCLTTYSPWAWFVNKLSENGYV
jgi:hypothetical protein